ncbi:MAG: DegT/DnrJ/EryC1/StrS family aminotransferase [Cyanobacteria bacterium SBLK]|nr:DegT/DnrJ/EryC1/StrS family aminotransferase [Cyanobacteria bacterium SBLK]
MNEIPYIDLKTQHAELKPKLLDAIANVLDHSHFILGREVVEFEEEFARLCGTRHAVGVNSGTDALILSLKALGIGYGDEVITVPNSFVASTTCIRLIGARPIFVDVGDDYNIDPEQIEAAITPKTKAILPVHLTGRPCKMDAILAIAKSRNLHVIEDAAQAILAEYKGKRVGSFGRLGCFSLHPLKNLNACGDGGIIATDDPDLYKQLKIRRNLGLQSRDNCIHWSHNSRLDTLQAAILLTKLPYLPQWTQQRRENARYYQTHLADIPQLQIPNEGEGEKSVYHTFVIQAEKRDELREFLHDRGIGSAIHYPVPIHLAPVARELGYQKGSFPVAEEQAKRILSLPIYHNLTNQQLERICQNLRSFYGSANPSSSS